MAGRITKSEDQLRPDPRYGDKVVSKFVNCIMLGGRKTAAEGCLYGAFDMIDGRLQKERPEGLPADAIGLPALHAPESNAPGTDSGYRDRLRCSHQT